MDGGVERAPGGAGQKVCWMQVLEAWFYVCEVCNQASTRLSMKASSTTQGRQRLAAAAAGSGGSWQQLTSWAPAAAAGRPRCRCPPAALRLQQQRNTNQSAEQQSDTATHGRDALCEPTLQRGTSPPPPPHPPHPTPHPPSIQYRPPPHPIPTPHHAPPEPPRAGISRSVAAWPSSGWRGSSPEPTCRRRGLAPAMVIAEASLAVEATCTGEGGWGGPRGGGWAEVGGVGRRGAQAGGPWEASGAAAAEASERQSGRNGGSVRGWTWP